MGPKGVSSGSDRAACVSGILSTFVRDRQLKTLLSIKVRNQFEWGLINPVALIVAVWQRGV